jgi:small GTP-binding protein
MLSIAWWATMAKQPYFEFKILLVGDPAVGKTSLMQKFVENRFDREYKPSIGVDFAYKNLEVGEKVARLIVWDVASQERFTPYRSTFYQQTNGALVVFDLTRPETLEGVENWMRELKQFTGDTPVVLVGNKADLDKKRKIRQTDVQPWIERYGLAGYVETSAMNGRGVAEAFQTLSAAIVAKRG